MLRKASLLFTTSLFLVVAAISSVSADGCPNANERPATDADAIVQNGMLTVGSCYNPNDPNIGQNFAQAKQNLSGAVCGGGVDIVHLDAKFAVCADKFMQQLRQASPGACIRSGYRSVQEQANACRSICGQLSCPGKCAPPGYSYHQKGLAVDVNYRTSNQQAWETASTFGIVNPGGLHRSDPNHFQAANTDCAGVPVPAGDQGDYYNDTNHFFPPPPAPPFDNQLRRMLPPPPPPQMQQPIQPLQQLTQPTPIPPVASSTPPIGTLNSTPYPPGTCNPQTYCSQGDGNIYYRATTCVDKVYQACSYGCSGLICNASSTANSQLGGLSSPSGTNDNANTSSNSSGTSTFDLIDFFANPPAATNIGTATPIDISQLIQDAGNASVLQPGSPAGEPLQPPAQGAGGYGPVPQQTFTSGDLANSPGAYGPQASTFQIALANLKSTLVDILNHLQPFGGRVGVPQTYAE